MGGGDYTFPALSVFEGETDCSSDCVSVSGKMKAVSSAAYLSVAVLFVVWGGMGSVCLHLFVFLYKQSELHLSALFRIVSVCPV